VLVKLPGCPIEKEEKVEWTPKVRHRNDNDFGGDRGS